MLDEAASAITVYDDALAWIAEHGSTSAAPLAVEVWVFDRARTQVLLVEHRWRGWVPPGGKVEAGESPRHAAERELWEETGLALVLDPAPAAVTVRSYHPAWPATPGLSYSAVADPDGPLAGEPGQAAAWTPLDRPWTSVFPDDIVRMRAHLGFAGAQPP